MNEFNHQVQQASTEREEMRKYLGAMIRCLGNQLLEASDQDDTPEGVEPVEILLSKTLTREWMKALHFAMRRL